MDYKETLNLPKTDFPMRANLPSREPEIAKRWEGLYAASLDVQGPDFVLHDGPPYSNGHIHMGHALNKIAKDIIVKYKTMTGHRAPFVPGWDNHGMPIEVEVIRRHGKLPREELRRLCREYASRWVEIQKGEFERLGIRGDWEHPYLTMSREYEAGIVGVFAELALAGYIYRGLAPIYWCPACATALAEAEIEYAEIVSPSIYVRFPIDGRLSALVWTTTPWTLPANAALAVHPDHTYAVVSVRDGAFILAEELVERALSAADVEEWEVLRTMPGTEVTKLTARHPLTGRETPIVAAEYVTLAEGTGIVHIAPGYGREDFEVGKRYGLPVISMVDEHGRFTTEAGEFVGLTVEEGNLAVVEALRERGMLVEELELVHSYPHCWRCGGPVIFRATVQWFLRMDHEELRKRILDEIAKIEWYPPESVNRITGMIENAPDWCISRQRAWGVGIPVFYCACGEVVMNAESLGAAHRLVETEGSDAWFAREAGEILPPGFTCPKCGGQEFTKETDILDVWFDSGSSCRIVLDEYPADLYLEGSDQHRGWFNKSLVIGVATKGRAPFRECITNGWMLDETGRTMHKSWGNIISPSEIVNKEGADILRLWVSSIDYFEDVRLGNEILARVTDSYRRIRNTLRFMLANLYDYREPAPLREIDRFALHRCSEMVRDARAGYEAYEFRRVYRAVTGFAAEMSAFYLDVIKDTLYVFRADSPERRSAQTALAAIHSAMVRVIAPITSFTADEVRGYMGESGSAQLALFPEAEHLDPELAERWERLLRVREAVYRAIEESRIPRLEAEVTITAPPDLYDFLASYEKELAPILIVSGVRLARGEFGITVERASGRKCGRCWLVLPSVGEHAVHPELCARCAEIVREVY
ncbi:MAG: isoleucine--tRNA ligase [Armatimonadota bacterium]